MAIWNIESNQLENKKNNINDENILGILFKSIYQSFLNGENKKNDSNLEIHPLIMGIENFEKINKNLNLNKEDWKKVIELIDVEDVDKEFIQNKIVLSLENKLQQINKLTKKEKQDFIENVFEPCIELISDKMDSLHAEKLSKKTVDLMLKKEIPRISDKSLNILIKQGDIDNILNTLLEYEVENQLSDEKRYLNYISKENMELMIEKADEYKIDIKNLYFSYNKKADSNIEKELRNKIYEKFLKTDRDYILVHISVGDTGWSEDFINEKIINISKDEVSSEKILQHWISHNLREHQIPKKYRNKGELSNKNMLQLINGLGKGEKPKYVGIYYDKQLNDRELGYDLILGIQRYALHDYGLSSKDIPFFRNLLDKNKGTNEYLLRFYFDNTLDNIIDLSENEVIRYVKNSNTSLYKNNFFNECFDFSQLHEKKTGKLLSFAIDSINLEYSEEAQNNLKQWFYQIRTTENDYQSIMGNIDSKGIEEIINNEKLLKVMGGTVLSSIDKIEKIWNIKIDKEKLIDKIDFNNIAFSFKYEEIVSEKSVPIETAHLYGVKIESVDLYTKKGQEVLVPNREIVNIWNQIAFSEKEIELIINKIDLKITHASGNLIESLFADINTIGISNKFIKDLAKNNEKCFENCIGKIVSSNDLSCVELIKLTKNLLVLKSEVEFNEDLIMKVYNKCSDEQKRSIDPEIIKSAKIISLMEDKELNDIDVAYDLIKRNKNNFYKLGKQLVEFLQLNKDNSEQILEKYNEEKIKGVVGYFKRKEKETLQERIKGAIEYHNKQQINPGEIIQEISKIDIRKLSEEEKKKVGVVINKITDISKDMLKDLSLTQNSDLKRCLESTFIGIVKTYSKISDNDKKENPELNENFNEIMNYCENQINKVIPEVREIKAKI